MRTRRDDFLNSRRRCRTPPWGRDEFKVGEMWNSNSVISWLLERSGIGVEVAGTAEPVDVLLDGMLAWGWRGRPNKAHRADAVS